MFKKYAIKKYGDRLPTKLKERYGEQEFYSARQIRATVFQCNFNPTYLPLAYLLFLDKTALLVTLKNEYPELSVQQYKEEIKDYLTQRKYYGCLEILRGK